MNSARKYSLAAGLFYLLTFVSIPTLALYRSVRAPNFVVSGGPDGPVILGILLEMIVALAGIGTAVALYPIVRRQGEARAVGFIASRTLEAATIAAVAALPIAVWEFSLGVYLTFWSFKASPIIAGL